MATVFAQVLVPEQVYPTLATRPDRVRECINAAEQAMNETAAEKGHRIAETPRLVDQRITALGPVELTFQAETERL